MEPPPRPAPKCAAWPHRSTSKFRYTHGWPSARPGPKRSTSFDMTVYKNGNTSRTANFARKDKALRHSFALCDTSTHMSSQPVWHGESASLKLESSFPTSLSNRRILLTRLEAEANHSTRTLFIPSLSAFQHLLIQARIGVDCYFRLVFSLPTRPAGPRLRGGGFRATFCVCKGAPASM